MLDYIPPVTVRQTPMMQQVVEARATSKSIDVWPHTQLTTIATPEHEYFEILPPALTLPIERAIALSRRAPTVPRSNTPEIDFGSAL